MAMDVTCPYCSSYALRMTGRELHPMRSDLANKHYHVCRNCDAWVGCADGTWEPLGRLANAELRRAKQDVHAALETIWTEAMQKYGWTKSKARNLTYSWLASEMGMGRRWPRIGDFNLDQCGLVASICRYRDPDLKALSDSHRAATKRSTDAYIYSRERNRSVTRKSSS